MTQEEKAEAYDRALKRAMKLYENSNGMILKKWLWKVFPELAEPSDERTRKALLHLVNSNKELSFGIDNYDGVKWEDIIAWIEKQDKHKRFRDFIQIGDKVTRNEAGELVNLSQLERIAKPRAAKPADNAKSKFKVKYAGNEYNVFEIKDINGVTYYGIEDEPNHIDYVKAENCEMISGYAIKENGSSYPTKPAMFSEKKPQRMVSAEAKEALYDKPTDEEMKELLRTEYEKGRADTIAEMGKEWSEEDKLNLKQAIYVCHQHGYTGVENWLKSIKQRIGG